MIYFIRETASGLVKIGYSSNAWARLSQIQTGTPGKLVLEAVIAGELKDEAALHVRFQHQHSRGEWFHWAKELADFVASQPQLERPRKPPKGPLEAWRRSNGLTLVELADRCATSHASIQRIECGKQNPSLALAVALEELTGIPARDFLIRRAA